MNFADTKRLTNEGAKNNDDHRARRREEGRHRRLDRHRRRRRTPDPAGAHGGRPLPHRAFLDHQGGRGRVEQAADLAEGRGGPGPRRGQRHRPHARRRTGALDRDARRLPDPGQRRMHRRHRRRRRRLGDRPQSGEGRGRSRSAPPGTRTPSSRNARHGNGAAARRLSRHGLVVGRSGRRHQAHRQDRDRVLLHALAGQARGVRQEIRLQGRGELRGRAQRQVHRGDRQHHAEQRASRNHARGGGGRQAHLPRQADRQHACPKAAPSPTPAARPAWCWRSAISAAARAISAT